jgi:putative ATPase
MNDLFAKEISEEDVYTPLADQLRPVEISDIVGQGHLTGEQGIFTKILESKTFPSMILWGPPGSGKTSLARLLANYTDQTFEQVSAIFSGVTDLKKLFEAARLRREKGLRTLLFIDEIHRFNKSQQDAFLPVVEDGTITLIGATTENPSFELNAALLSRCQVFVLKRLDNDALESILKRAESQLNKTLPLNDEARELLKTIADGDGRFVLTIAEQVFSLGETLNAQDLLSLVTRRSPLYDKNNDAHYNMISALHKSVRGSDVDAALYYFARMLASGEDPKYISRRMTRMAIEDIGLAEPGALQQCLSAWDAYERLGSPEGELALAQALIYLATAPKSNAAYSAYKKANKVAKETGSYMPPKHILNAPTALMKEQGYGHGYNYDHDEKDAFSGQNYFPEEMERMSFYSPVERGFEREVKKRLEYWEKLREKKK